MEDRLTEEEQNYLRLNILEKGYDATAFINFLKSKKGEQREDISIWSMPDLQKVVQDFISIHLSDTITNQKFEQKKSEENNQINPPINQINDQNTQNNQNIENLETLKKEDYGIIISDIVECRKSETTELSKYKNLEITVSDPKKVDKGFFIKAYTDFEIKTNPCDFTVRRQHVEFVWLRERLSVIYNTNILPRLPKKEK